MPGPPRTLRELLRVALNLVPVTAVLGCAPDTGRVAKACENDTDPGGPGTATESSSGGSTADETETDPSAPTCWPSEDWSCAEAGASPLRGLLEGEFLGVSVLDADGPRDLVFAEEAVSRPAPDLEHPCYPLILSKPGNIAAPLADGTREELQELASELSFQPGFYGEQYAPVTVRVPDHQFCFDEDTGCTAFGPLLERLLELDEQLTSNWEANPVGLVYPLAEVQTAAWPLEEDFGGAGTLELSESDYNRIGDYDSRTWFDGAAGLACTTNHCSGSDETCVPDVADIGACCDRWFVDVYPVQARASSLSDTNHRVLLAGAQPSLLRLPVLVEGSTFEELRDVDLLTFVDPDDPKLTRRIAVTVAPSPRVTEPL